MEVRGMRILHLTHDQFDVLYDLLENTVQSLEDEVGDDVFDYEAFEIYQTLRQMKKGGK